MEHPTHEETRRSRFPLRFFPAMALLLAVLQHISNRALRYPGWRLTTWQGMHQYLDGWAQFDAVQYLGIAEHGYAYTVGVRSNVVWFPLYPLLTRAVDVVMGDMMLAGILVAFVAGFAAALLYWRWLGRHVSPGRPQVVAFVTLMVYPYAWYLYGVPHSDSLFLACSVAAFVLLESDRRVLAGIAGALATASRPNGLALIAALAVLGLEHDGVLSARARPIGSPVDPSVNPPGDSSGDASSASPGRVSRFVDRFAVPVHIDRSRFRATTLVPAALSMLGIGAYMVYLGVRFGDPIAFVTNSRLYHAGSWRFLHRAYFVAVRDHVDPTFPLTLTAQALFTLLAAVSVPFVGRRFGWGYATWVLLLVAIPFFSVEDFMGNGRYLIAAFPTAALAGEWLADHRRARIAWLTVATIAILGLDMAFARSWYLS